MIRDEALDVIADVALKNGAALFIGNGYNARSLCAIRDRAQFFYMLGSMGLGPTLAAGFSHCSGKPVIVVEGDGNALMGLSGFPVASNAARGAFVHLVLDNGLYESTGGQCNLSFQVDFLQVAQGAGYEAAYRAEDTDSLAMLLEYTLAETRPSFLHVPTGAKDGIIHPRVPFHPNQVAQRFREVLSAPLSIEHEGHVIL
ncbi:MAG TPA: thiamine pyrophosphate-dependent enzyme [Ktedonobacteraceae bacterium]|nr:thiamine pyrophosphate-dependent enzyme [Ktedonobacteraceae bacterium]